MTFRKLYLSVVLALFAGGSTYAQTPSSRVLAPSFHSTAELANNAASLPATSGTTVAGQYGPFGIGKPRSFPIWRHWKENHAKNKANLRASPLGKIIKDMRKMASKITGGMVPATPTPNAVELAAPGPQGAAAQIQKDVLDAPKRLAAIQQLATVDCHWYPEALAQLSTALRTDRSECVRLEAAKILTHCGCCESHVVNALRICVAGTESDGNPGERSISVRNQAAIALESCLANGAGFDAPHQIYRPEYPVGESTLSPAQAGESEAGNVSLASYDQADHQPNDRKKQQLSLKLESEKAHDVLKLFRESKPEGQSPAAAPSSLSEVWKKSK